MSQPSLARQFFSENKNTYTREDFEKHMHLLLDMTHRSSNDMSVERLRKSQLKLSGKLWDTINASKIPNYV